MIKKPWHKLADQTLESRFGIICPDGLFYPCDFMGHMNLADEMVEAGFLNPDGNASYRTYLDVEKHCVMISSAPLTTAKRLTPRQKLTLEKHADKHGYITPEGFYLGDVLLTLVRGRAQCQRA